MEWALWRLGLRVSLAFIFMSASDLMAMERICLRTLVSVDNAEHATTSPAIQLPLLLIKDPHHQLDPIRPLAISLADWQVHESVKAIHRVLVAEQDRVKIILDEWNTWIVEHSKNPELFTSEELEGPARIILILKHPLDENPELTFQGVITQLLFVRLPAMKGKFKESFDEGSARLLAAVKERAKNNEPLRQRLAEMSNDDINDQIHLTVKLRITWILKIRFYERNIGRYPSLEQAPLINSTQVATLNYLADRDRAPIDSPVTFDNALLVQFVEFYSHNISQRLDPEIIRAVWPIPLSGLWESSLLSPDLLYPKPVATPVSSPIY